MSIAVLRDWKKWDMNFHTTIGSDVAWNTMLGKDM